MCVPNDYNETTEDTVQFNANGLLTPQSVTNISNELTKEMSSCNMARPSTQGHTTRKNAATSQIQNSDVRSLDGPEKQKWLAQSKTPAPVAQTSIVSPKTDGNGGAQSNFSFTGLQINQRLNRNLLPKSASRLHMQQRIRQKNPPMPSLKMLFLKHPVSTEKFAQTIVVPPKDEEEDENDHNIKQFTEDDMILKTLEDQVS